MVKLFTAVICPIILLLETPLAGWLSELVILPGWEREQGGRAPVKLMSEHSEEFPSWAAARPNWARICGKTPLNRGKPILGGEFEIGSENLMLLRTPLSHLLETSEPSGSPQVCGSFPTLELLPCRRVRGPRG
jgi:hypothetical protein